MNADDFRELALSLDGAEEGSHMGAPDFRVGGRIFATLAMQHLGFGNLMLSPELQKALIAEAPEVFLPIPGGWGRMGCTHVRLVEASAQQLLKGLHAAWSFRIDKNKKSRASKTSRGAENDSLGSSQFQGHKSVCSSPPLADFGSRCMLHQRQSSAALDEVARRAFCST